MKSQTIDFFPLCVYDSGMIENNVRKIRRDRGVTLAQLAAALNMTQPSLTRIETGNQPLCLDRVAEIADALGCRPTDILPTSWTPAMDVDRFMRIWGAVNRALTARHRVISEQKKIRFVLYMYENGCGLDDNIAANDNEVANQMDHLKNLVA